MRGKPIIIGLGILIILLALAGIGSSRSVYGGNCGFCHVTFTQPVNLTQIGSYFKEIHRFDGTAVPTTNNSCTECHVNPPTTDLNLTSTGQNYSSSHRYNDTTLASARLGPPACYNCHVDVNGSNFTFLSGPPTYLKSEMCQNCHRLRYDNWTGTMHRVMLTNSTNAQAMNLPLPSGFGWENVSFMIVGKSQMRYLNESGYFFEKYDAVNQTFAPLNSSQYTCGRCHTTGYSPSGNQSGLPGIVGTWGEPGIACERCHGPAGNGHQVKVNASGDLCLECHSGAERQNTAAWKLSKHAPPLEASTRCLQCHSPFDYFKNRTVTSESAINVPCAVCHNPHNTSDDQYKDLLSPNGFNATRMADVKDLKLSFFNSNESRAAGTDVYNNLTTPSLITKGIDASYPGPILVTGPVSEVLCSQCHYNHGLGGVGGVNLTHGRKFGPLEGIKPNATCVDCHMATSQRNHSFNVKDEINFPSKTCSRGTECHVTSNQNLNQSLHSVVPEVREWKSSRHNDTAFVLEGSPENTSRCAQCHSPINWDPLNASETIAPEDFKGVTCAICHNIHDMGDWLTKTEKIFGVAKPYAWYTRDAYNRTSFFRANYTLQANTTELCTNCHHNRPDTSTPGWIGRGPHGAVVPHISPQKDMFLGSFKDSNLKFECVTCHMYSKTIDPTNLTEKVLPDSQKIAGHSFRVNATGLQNDGSWNNQSCSSCHVNGSALGTVGGRINNVQIDIQKKWNETNTTVENAWNTYNASTGEKNLSGMKLAEAFFKLYLVKNDGSWGVHNPQKAVDLLNDSGRLADEAVAALTSNVTANVTAPPSPPPSATFNILGFKINGTNNNGMGIGNWNIMLLNNTGAQIASTMTDSMGFYNFTALANGTYNVTEEMRAGWTNTSTSPMSQIVTINGADKTNVNFTNILLSPTLVATFNISGFKINNATGSGVQGWNITLTNSTMQTSMPTGVDGSYMFMGLVNGTYNVTEGMKTGWTNVSPTSQHVTIVGSDMMNINFTNQPPTAATFNISGFKINDTNGNGVWNPGEMGIPNWNIMLLNDTGVQLANTSTNAQGFYQFMNIFPGRYNVVEEMKPGFTATNATSKAVTVENINITNINFTNQVKVTPLPVGSISGTKFNDLNGNGIRDSGEPGLANWTIELRFEPNGSLLLTTTTDENGNYIFTNLEPINTVGNYTVREVLKPSWMQTAPASGFYAIPLEPGQNMNGIDFGNSKILPQATFNISGFKINDTNGNGVQNPGEMGIPNWNINLLNGTTGTQIASISTDASGFYQFMNLSPGDYNVTEEMRVGFTPTGAASKVITIRNMNVTGVNFLNHITVSPSPTMTPLPTITNTISGFKINDTNGNGVWDPGEMGIENWNIKLIGTGAETTGINKETTTDADGFYSFDNLKAGNYIIMETLQEGFVPTSATVKAIVIKGENSINNNFTNRPISSLLTIPFISATGEGRGS